MDDIPVHLCSYLVCNKSPSPLPPPLPPSSPRPLFTVYQGQETSAEEARTRVLSLASTFSDELNLHVGDRVATLALTTPHHLETLLAVTAAGGIAAPLNWRWSVSEVQYAIEHLQTEVLCADEPCLGLAKQVAELCPSVKALVILGGSGRGRSSNKGGAALQSTNYSQGDEKFSYILVNAEDQLTSNTRGTTSPPIFKQPHDGTAFIIFTSGTTGPPRAAVLSHAALHFQCNAKLRCCGYNKSDIYLHTAQLFHVGGLCSALAMLLAGAQHIFLPIFRAAECLNAFEMYKVTSFIAVPTMISDLLTTADAEAALGRKKEQGRKIRNIRYPHVQSVLVGAGGLSSKLTTRLRELIPNATVYSAYGMTEACSSLTFSTVIDKGQACQPEINSGASESIEHGVYVGCPPPGIELAIIPLDSSTTEDNRNTTNQDSIVYSPPSPPSPSLSNNNYVNKNFLNIMKQGYGEIVTRGPHTMLGYWNDPEATSVSFLPMDIDTRIFRNTTTTSTTTSGTATSTTLNKWMRTGDLGYLKSISTDSTVSTSTITNSTQQQYVWLVGRAKDVIKSGGENVPAAEVERALSSHPAVAVAAVVGLPDDRLGERVAAVVALNDGYTWQGPKVVYTLGESTGLSSSCITHTNTLTTINGVVLQQHCRFVAGLAGFKLPRTFFLFETDDEIPRNATGKVVKPQLKEKCIRKMAEAAVSALRSRL
jgi:o-succinylbenzoate---CoA ligase